MEIRPERAADAPRIRAVLEAAFGGPDEGVLVDALRAAGLITVALVAEDAASETLLGHIVLSRIAIEPAPRGEPPGETGGGAVPALSLAPVAVAPDHQRRGIGIALVRAALDAARSEGHDAVIVLGHPEYYPRFGFVPASRFGITGPFDAPDEAFMAMSLRAQRPPAGRVIYGPQFFGSDPG